MPFPVEVALIHEAERQLGRQLPMDLRVRGLAKSEPSVTLNSMSAWLTLLAAVAGAAIALAGQQIARRATSVGPRVNHNSKNVHRWPDAPRTSATASGRRRCSGSLAGSRAGICVATGSRRRV